MRSQSALALGLAVVTGIAIGSFGGSGSAPPDRSHAARPTAAPASSGDRGNDEIRALAMQVAAMRGELARLPAPAAAYPPAPAAAYPPAPDVSNPTPEPESPDQASARAAAIQLVDATLASGRWTADDRRELQRTLASASPAAFREAMSRIAIAINSDRVIPDPPDWRTP